MAALPVHHTVVDSKSTWDKAKVTATGKTELRYVSAWVDSSGDASLIGSYKLMHHYANGGPAILAGVNNAKSRLSQTNMPDADRAGVEAHLNAHQKDAKQSIAQRFVAWLDELIGIDEPDTVEQAISMPDVYNLVDIELNPNSGSDTMPMDVPYKRLIDCYLDGAEIYAVIGIEGKIYKSLITIVSGGVTLGELVPVEIDYKPVGQSFKVVQQADGAYRWFAIPAATAVLNKKGYLNSRELYDNFIKHVQEVGYPYLSFYHVGKAVNLGTADFVEREGYTLLVSGTFNDTALAQCLAKDPDNWGGVSIGYLVNPNTIQNITVDEAVKVPVHTDGILVEVSAVQAIDAACVMTAFYSKGVNNMNQEILNKLKKLAGTDPAALAEVDALAEEVDQTNQVIESENMVRQENTTTPSSPTPPPPPVAVVEPIAPPATTPEFTLTDEAVQAIAEQVRSGFAAEIATVQAAFQTQLTEALSPVNQTLTGLQSRLDALELTDKQKISQVVSDMPRTTAVVGYQPRNQGKPPVDPPEADLNDMAEQTLAKIKAAQSAQVKRL